VVVTLLVLRVEGRSVDPQLASCIGAGDLELALVGAEGPVDRDQAEHAARVERQSAGLGVDVPAAGWHVCGESGDGL
jgi:hypothetical protein